MAALLNRTMNLGKLAEYRQRLNALKIEIHSAVTAIIVHFEPFDLDLKYVENIVPERLKVNVNTIDRKMKEVKRLTAEIKRLEEETGDPSSV